MTGHVKYQDLSSHELSRLARFKQVAEKQLLNLGAAIEDARKEKGWSRSTLGKRIPVEGKTVERWEKGQTGGAMESLGPIADALDTTTDALLAAAAAKGQEDQSQPEGSPLDALSTTGDLPDATAAAVEALRLEIVGLRTQLLSRIERAQQETEALLRKQAPPASRSKSSRK